MDESGFSSWPSGPGRRTAWGAAEIPTAENDFPQAGMQGRPALWDPNAAANWSVLFTPAFGAFLHTANWLALGKPGRAVANVVWLWVTVVFLIAIPGSLFLPPSPLLIWIRWTGTPILLVAWYLTQGEPQVKYVKENLRDGFVRKSWWLPLLVGAAGVTAYGFLMAGVLGVYLAATAEQAPDATKVAAVVEPLLLAEWQKRPGWQNASIQRVKLTHRGGKRYTGVVESELGGRPRQWWLEVTLHDRFLEWKVEPMAGR